MRTLFATIGVALLLSGCAARPKFTYSYFLPVSETKVTVVHTISCTKDGETLLLSTAEPTVLTSYRANTAAAEKVNTSKLSSGWAESNFTMGWYPDGRLKSINQTSTGQGEETIKAALATFGALAGAAPEDVDDATRNAQREHRKQIEKPVCTKLKATFGDEPVVLTYQGKLNVGLSDKLPLEPAPSSEVLHQTVKDELPIAVPKLRFDVVGLAPLAPPAEGGLSSKNAVPIELPNVAVATLRLMSIVCRDSKTGRTACPTGDVVINDAERIFGDVVWEGTEVVPTTGTETAWIPHARAFGKNTFALTLGAAGNIESVTYAQTPGAVGAFGSVSAVAAAAAPPDAATTAAAMKGEVEVIIQSRRLAACRADPATCE